MALNKSIARLWRWAGLSSRTQERINRAHAAAFNKTRPRGPQSVLCWAPFRNLYFTYSGDAVACCNNRSYTFGRWPEQSIHDIWFGEKAEGLRRLIRQNDLSNGCSNCMEHLKGGNFDAIKAMMYDHLPANPNGYPSVIELELSTRCNIKCIMCYWTMASDARKNQSGKKTLDSPYDKSFVEELSKFVPYLTEIKFYGGEPFLAEINYDAMEMILNVKKELSIIVQTNATILNERVQSLLDRGRFHVTASLEAVDKGCYEAIRIGANFEQVMDNILAFADYAKKRGTFFGISTCAMRQNWRELPEIVALCNRLDVPVYFHTIWHPPGCALWNLPSGELGTIRDHLAARVFPGESANSSKNRKHYQDLVSQLGYWRENALTREKNEVRFEGLSLDSLDYLFRKIEVTLLTDLACGKPEAQKRLDRMVLEISAAVEELPPGYPISPAMEIMNQLNGPFLLSLLEPIDRKGILGRFLSLREEILPDCDTAPR